MYDYEILTQVLKRKDIAINSLNEIMTGKGAKITLNKAQKAEVKTLTDAKNLAIGKKEKKEKLEMEKQNEINTQIVDNFQCNPLSLNYISEAIKTMEIKKMTKTKWKMADNTIKSVTLTQLRNAYATANLNNQTRFFKYDTLKSNV